jgi:hypothetical protein
MPWRELSVMDERVKFMARVLEGEKVAVLAREFGISRKTAYKIVGCYDETGLEGLTDRSRRPYRHANKLPFQIEKTSVRLKQEKPGWGAPKILELPARRYPDVHAEIALIEGNRAVNVPDNNADMAQAGRLECHLASPNVRLSDSCSLLSKANSKLARVRQEIASCKSQTHLSKCSKIGNKGVTAARFDRAYE